MKNLLMTIPLLFSLLIGGCAKRNNSSILSKDGVILNTTETAEDREYRIISDDQIDRLNTIIKKKRLSSEEQIMQEYAPEDKHAEGNYLYVLKRTTDNPEKITVTLLEDCIMDDSMKARKVVMDMRVQNDQYYVIKIKESYQCWKDRGHEEWNAGLCL
ncbi:MULTISPECIES: hypothetical protein [Myroides]|uniref:Lipoprotein n=1 Tax=Myroides albus TaxID=2562892 RepID=A0A6I3LQJ6_9FLAO|nr:MULTISPECIES: hypothetical protein [Myroides]MTG98941.1 hypothetical protein [Myroides albus]MVX36681.1 hypothetical protein [Myroides sp. LoEW2-1]UVD78591.1 hypothetical protein NWE55_10695 [Myroides albus]